MAGDAALFRLIFETGDIFASADPKGGVVKPGYTTQQILDVGVPEIAKRAWQLDASGSIVKATQALIESDPLLVQTYADLIMRAFDLDLVDFDVDELIRVGTGAMEAHRPHELRGSAHGVAPDGWIDMGDNPESVVINPPATRSQREKVAYVVLFLVIMAVMILSYVTGILDPFVAMFITVKPTVIDRKILERNAAGWVKQMTAHKPSWVTRMFGGMTDEQKYDELVRVASDHSAKGLKLVLPGGFFQDSKLYTDIIKRSTAAWATRIILGAADTTQVTSVGTGNVAGMDVNIYGEFEDMMDLPMRRSALAQLGTGIFGVLAFLAARHIDKTEADRTGAPRIIAGAFKTFLAWPIVASSLWMIANNVVFGATGDTTGVLLDKTIDAITMQLFLAFMTGVTPNVRPLFNTLKDMVVTVHKERREDTQYQKRVETEHGNRLALEGVRQQGASAARGENAQYKRNQSKFEHTLKQNANARGDPATSPVMRRRVGPAFLARMPSPHEARSALYAAGGDPAAAAGLLRQSLAEEVAKPKGPKKTLASLF